MIVLIAHCFGSFAVAGGPGHLTAPYAFALSWLFVEQGLRFIFNGDAAVMVFFTLSGCVLALQLDRMQPLVKNLRAYYVRRFFRIYPTAMAATLLGLAVILVLRQWTAAPLTVVAAEAVQKDTSWRAMLLNLLLVRVDFNSPLWSLKVEVWMSMAFPLIYWAVQKPTRCAVTVLLCTWLLFGESLGHYTSRLAELAFVIGAMLPRYGALRIDLRRLEMPLVLIALVCAAAARRFIEARGVYLLIETLAAFVVIRSVFIERPNARWLDHRWVVRLGELSYGLYVMHMPVLWLVAAGIAFVAGESAVVAHGAVAACTLFAVVFPISLGLASIAHRTLELPGIAIGHRLGRVDRAGATASPVSALSERRA